ncbi:MAG: NADH-quinone oxidoreductase subunit NuoF [Ignavibacteria bacterium]|jgi:NADH-quinone oxidoreductase subunit F|nr:NADH-quinone oxidoreductase subunit NuoF [Ignavibacteria bacterium]
MPKYLLPDIDNLNKLAVYRQNGGYEQAKKALQMSPADIINIVKTSNLKGRGGAGFPTGVKWSFMPQDYTGPKYLCVNGDESEPGSFKDRQILEFNPHQLIEGTIVAAKAMGVTTSYIYIRGEYHKWVNCMQTALDEAYDAGLLGDKMKQTFGTDFKTEIYVHKGAGAYVCGEETAQMNSIEGKRAYPRNKPPFPAGAGLWGHPTTVNNAETIATVPAIFRLGAEEFAKIGTPTQCGNMLFGVSGNINKPGVYELPTGTLMTHLLYDICGGIPNNKKLKAVIPGGASMVPLRADEIENLPMDSDSLRKIGSGIGTGGIIVIDEDANLAKICLRISHFFHHESCGQCTPCREGNGWMEKILKRIVAGDATSQDIDLLYDVASNIENRTVCALGDACAWPIKGFINKFRDEFEKCVKPTRSFVAPNTIHSKHLTQNELVYAV